MRQLIIAISVALAAQSIAGEQNNQVNPSIENFAAQTESLEDELVAGKLVVSRLLGTAKLGTDKKVQRYVNLIGVHIASQTERKAIQWRFGVIDSTAVNAFAAPGGYILVTSGLLELLETEDELAAVLAHEISHVVRKHHFRVIRKQQMLEFGMNAVKIQDSDTSNKMSSLVAQVLARGLDKSAEFEADKDGMVYLARAGYDSSALLKVLEKLSKIKEKDETIELMFSTHPLNSDRAEALAAFATPDIQKAAVPSSTINRFSANFKK
jgi:predicted Zn-dependent protease